MSKNKVPPYTAEAIQRYRQKTVQKQVTFNPSRPDEAAILKALDDEGAAFSTKVKELLKTHYGIKDQ